MTYIWSVLRIKFKWFVVKSGKLLRQQTHKNRFTQLLHVTIHCLGKEIYYVIVHIYIYIERERERERERKKIFEQSSR